MEDLGAEVAELHGLAVGHRLQELGVRHEPRIAAVHSVHVGPDLAALGAQDCGKAGRRVVGAVPSEKDKLPVFAAAGEAGHQNNPGEPEVKRLDALP